MQKDKRDRLIDLLYEAEGQVNNDVPSLESIADYLIAHDVVPVVRCKDCRYCIDEGMSGLYCEHSDGRNTIHCRPDDYCNDGERKADHG